MKPCLALLVLCSLAACKHDSPGAGKGAAKGPSGKAMFARRAFPVEVRPVATEVVQYRVEAVGSLEPHEEVRVTARVAGVLEKVSFEEGMAVTPQTVLAEIDRPRHELAVQKAKASWDKTLAELGKAETILQHRMTLRARDPSLLSSEEMANVTAQVAAARGAAAEAAASHRIAQHDYEHSQIRPLIKGIINTKHVSTGQYVTAGTPIATIVDTSKLKLRFKVSESESVKLQHLLAGNQPLEFTVRPLPGRTFKAKLIHLSPVANPQTRMVECLGLVDEPDPGLRPGFFAVISAAVQTRAQAIVIPDTAMLPTERGFISFVVEEKRARQRKVVPGLFVREGWVEILSGLKVGEPLVVTGAGALREGAEVVVVGAAKKAAPPGGPGGPKPAAAGR